MTDFFMTLIAVSVLGGAVCMLSPDGDMKKYIRLIASFCLVCAVSAPIFSAVKNSGDGLDGLFPTVDDSEVGYEEIYGEALAKGAEDTLERVLKERAVAELGFGDSEIDIDVALKKSSEEYQVSGVTAYIHGGGVLIDPKGVSLLVNEVCGCACTLIYD